ncbi:MAG: GNAT family N-acetyltransferase [Acidobacteriota bacterium]|nr:GNAT family N-acetyltransferase [Acidobacteriota bacterium]
MAALAEQFPSTGIHDLRAFRAPDLDPLLRECEDEWRNSLAWNFDSSSALVRKFLDLHSLNGSALVDDSGVTGYSYFVFEDNKGLVGDLYVAKRARTVHHEQLLIGSVLQQIRSLGQVPRIEAQIMFLSAPLQPFACGFGSFEMFPREFLGLLLPRAAQTRPLRLPSHIALEIWSEPDQEQAAHLIPATYHSHIDSQINDQYRTVSGARKFLQNIVQYPGCGVFQGQASVAAHDRRTGRLCGMLLSSLVAPGSGHITQVCVHPEYQGMGLGLELLRQSLDLLEAAGCRTVSLTVSAANTQAARLYERAGFRPIRSFAAYVWQP